MRIPLPLRSFTGGAAEVCTHGATVGEVLEELGPHYDGLLQRVMTAEGTIRNFVNVYVGAEDIRALQGLATPVSDGDVISIIPAVAGGAR